MAVGRIRRWTLPPLSGCHVAHSEHRTWRRADQLIGHASAEVGVELLVVWQAQHDQVRPFPLSKSHQFQHWIADFDHDLRFTPLPGIGWYQLVELFPGFGYQ